MHWGILALPSRELESVGMRWGFWFWSDLALAGRSTGGTL